MVMNTGDLQYRRPGFDPWVGKIPWRRKWQPLQCSCLENPMDRETWWVTVHGVTKSCTPLGNEITATTKQLFIINILLWNSVIEYSHIRTTTKMKS